MLNKVLLGFCSTENVKNWHEVLFRFYSIENVEIKYGWGFNLFKMLK